ncbi:hypothetical protein N7454_005870 [Penicillium verhagenii]|nr:hypothetical protein N7454_005870 [Penicillium verhagenii]
MLPAAERDEYGASGLEQMAEVAIIGAASLALGEDLFRQRPRSRSTSPRAAEKAHDLAPKSQSRPSSPEVSRNQDQSRRMSINQSTESPTAVPLHFRRPPMSPGLHRSVPSEAPTPPGSTGSPTQSRHRRPKSVEMSGEMRPLFLVERHGSNKVEPVVDEMPSLPSSKASSRAPSVENLRALNDDDAVNSWEPIDPTPLIDSRRPMGLRISTEQANEPQADYDVLDSQQATPTAESFGQFSESARKKKREPEFYSPSDLLRDPAGYPVPSSNLEALPSPEGSVIAVKDLPENTAGDQEHERGLDSVQEPTRRPEEEAISAEKSTPDATGLGFAGFVDAAIIAAAKEDSKSGYADKEISEPLAQLDDQPPPEAADHAEKAWPEPQFESSTAAEATLPGFSDMVDAAVVAQATKSASEELGEPGTAVEEQPPAQLEPEPLVEVEADKEFVPESSEQPIESLAPQPEEDPVVDETKETKSQKKKKKKAKKKQADESTDLPPDPTTAEEQIPAVDAAEAESHCIDPESTPITETEAPIETEVSAESQLESAPVEASRDLEFETLPDGLAESIEVLAPTEDSPLQAAEPDLTASAEFESEAVEPATVTEPEPEPQSEAAVIEPAVDDQTEDSAGLSKKEARKNKKKNKKNKSVSSVAPEEEVSRDVVEEQLQETVPSAEPQTHQEDQEHVLQAEDAIKPEETLAAEESAEKALPQDYSITEAPVQPEQESSDFQDAWEMVDPTAPNSVEGTTEERNVQDMSMSTESFVPVEAPTPELQEGEQSQPAATEEQPSEEVNVVANPEEVAETDSDAFHEAVEEQSIPTEDVKEVETELAPELAPEAVADIATTTPAGIQETQPEETPETQSKKSKKNKKKNRKSAAFDEPETPSEPQVVPEETSREIEPEQLTANTPVESQEPAISQSSEAQEPTADETPLVSEEVPTDAPLQVSEEATAIEEAVPMPSEQVDVEPTPSAEPVKESEENQNHSAVNIEAEAEVPLTAAQKKAAKKAARKAKQESFTSIPEDTPAEAASTESQIVETQAEEPAEQATPLVSDEVATDAPVQVPEQEEVAQEPEATSPEQLDVEQSASTESTKEIDNAQDQPAAEIEAETEVPLNAAQRKAAKKAAKKKAQQESLSSIPVEENPVTETPAEVTPTGPQIPEAQAEEPLEQATDAPVSIPEKDEVAQEPEATSPEQLDVEQSASTESAKEIDEAQNQPTADVEGEPEVPLNAAQRKAAKKAAKKKAQQESLSSIAVEESSVTETPAEATPTEAQVAEPQADEPFVSQQTAADVPLPVSEEVVAQEAEATPPEQLDVQEVASTESAKEIDETQDQLAAEIEAEPEVPLTASQKKAAKKAAKKKAQQEALSSTTLEESPVTEISAEVAPTEAQVAEPQADEPLVSEETAADAPVPVSEQEVAVQEPELELTSSDQLDAEPTSTESVKEVELEEPQNQPTAETEAEPEFPLTAAQKKAAKKAAKKKAKQDSVSSIPGDETPAEIPSTENQPAEATQVCDSVEPQMTESSDPIPEAETTTIGESKEIPASEVIPTEVADPKDLEESEPALDSVEETPGVEAVPEEIEQTKELKAGPEPALEAAVETDPQPAAAEPITEASEVSQEKPDVEQQSEEPPAGLSKSQKKKWREKQRKLQQESMSSVPEQTPAIESSVLPEASAPEPAVEPESLSPDAMTQETIAETTTEAPVESSKDLDAPFPAFSDAPASEEVTVSTTDVDAADPSKDAQAEPVSEDPVTEEAAPFAELVPDQETQIESAEAEQPEEDESTMTAAEKRKEKKKNKRKSKQLESQPASDAEPSSEQGPTEKTEESVEPEPSTPAELPPSIDEAAAVAVAEADFDRKPEGEDSQDTPAVEKDSSTVDAPGLSSEPELEQVPDVPPMDEVSSEPVVADDSAAIQTAEENAPPSGESSEEKALSDKLAEEAVANVELPSEVLSTEDPAAATVESAPTDRADETELNLVGSKKKNKKKKKKGQSTPTEQELLPESQPETPIEEALTESTPIEDFAPVLPEEAQKPEESEPLQDKTEDLAVEQPVTEAAETEPESVSKKSKKDKKKKRKSVAFDDENNVTPSDSQAEQELEFQAAPPTEAVASELTPEEPAQAPAVDAPEAAQEETPKQVLDTTETVEPIEQATEPEVQETEGPKELQDSSTAVQDEEQPVAVAAAEVEEEDLELANLSAKERKKIKKQREKERKKNAKSVDLTMQEPSTPTETQQPEAEASQPQDSETTATEGISSMEPDAETSKLAEATGVTEPDTTATVEGVSSKEATEQAQLVEQQLTNTIAETPAEPNVSKELDGPSEPTTEAEPDSEMTAEERRKAKRAEKKKKRKSKTPGADELTAESDAATTNIVQDAEKDITELNTSVTAPSPAEDDGKENQSHDIGTPDVPPQSLTSTDDIVSSQVEQPQLENRSSNYPPQPVLERSDEFRESEDGVEKGSDEPVAHTTLEVEDATGGEEKDIGVGETEEEKVDEMIEKDLENVLMEEERGEENFEIVDFKDETVVPEEKMNVNEEATSEVLDERPAQTTENIAPSKELELVEVEESGKSKKQKKKDKKKNKKNQQEEETIESELVPEPETVTVDEGQTEVVPSATEEQEKDVVPELDPASAIEELPVDQDQATAGVLEPQVVENVNTALNTDFVDEKADKNPQEEAQEKEIEPSVANIDIAEDRFNTELVQETEDVDSKMTGEEQPAATGEVEPVKLSTEVPSQETPAPTSEAPEETVAVTPVAEDPIDEFQGMNKKQRKKKMAEKAAAAAAAVAIETETASEQQSFLDQPLTTEQFLDTPIDRSELPHDAQRESVQTDISEPSVLVPVEPVADVSEQPIQEPEAPIEVSEKPTDREVVEEEAAVVQPELSKKEKRKAKKKSKQGGADLAMDLADEPSAPVSETEHEHPEAPLSVEAPSAEEPKENVFEMEPEITAEETPVDDVHDIEIEHAESTATHEHEKPAEEPRSQLEDEFEKPNDDFIPVSFDSSFPAETDTQDYSVEPSQDAAEFLDQEFHTKEDELEGVSQVQALEQDLQPLATEQSFDDPPLQVEEIPVLDPRKMSKKELRKAKKKGLLPEDIPEDFEHEMSESTTTDILAPESTTVVEEAQTSANPELIRDRDLEAVPEVESLEKSPPNASEPVNEEPEALLSRKDSKASKKAKKAAKKAQALELQSPANDTDRELELPVDKELSFKEEPETEALAPRETKQDEEWPTIEWEQGRSERPAPAHDQTTEPEPVTVIRIPDPPEAIEEYDEHAIPTALQEAQELEAGSEEPLSKSAKKKAKKNKRKSEQVTFAEPIESAHETIHKDTELAMESKDEPPAEISDSHEIEVEPPTRSLTPGGSSVANLFPGLPRSGFRLKKTAASVKDSAEDETTEDLEANRDIAIPVSEAPPYATTESKQILETEASPELPLEATEESYFALKQHEPATEVLSTEESIHEPELPVQGERSLNEPASGPVQSGLDFDFLSTSSSTHMEEHSTSRHLLPSQMEGAAEAACGLRRTPSVLHGRHQHTPRTWNLEDQTIPAMAPSPPRSLFGPFHGEHDSISRPRTPLGTIAEQEPVDGFKATMAQHGTSRLEIKPEHVLRPVTPERPVPTARSISPVRKFTDNSRGREAWPTPENEARRSQEDLAKSRSACESPILKTPEHGMPVLRPSDSKGKLRRTNRSTSSDLRAASRALDSQPPSNLDLDQLPSSSSYDPVTDKGKRPMRNMSDVYEGWGETPSSPRSPSRPPSVRHRRSMQHLQDLESRLDQLISDNRLLAAARDEAEDRLRNSSVARRKSDQALYTSGADLRDRKAEVEQLKSSVDWLQKETTRLTQENEALTASNAALAAAHAAEVSNVRESSTRELDDLRSQHDDLSSQVDRRVRQEIESAIAQKDAELRRLRTELEAARDKVQELQQQISASVHDNALVVRDEDYFHASCQKLCGHVQQWVLRFSKHSDHRRCRPLSELKDEKIADRFDNALLDGSDADSLLSDRVRRRDVFMSVVMSMVWEYIFTRYLFGMDREQRQKLKSLEKQLGEVGPRRAVHRWRATTLTLLSRRPAFASQRDSDTEAVALEIFGTLSRVLPPPSQVEAQLLESLRKVLRVAVTLSLEMRTQLAEFIMLPPLQPEYDTNGDLARQVYFNASLMNERSGETISNDELESQQAVVRIVLFPLVVKKGNDVGEGDDEVVVCPAQVLIARPGKDKKLPRMMSGDRMSLDANKSVHSVAPSTFTMDMGSNQF